MLNVKKSLSLQNKYRYSSKAWKKEALERIIMLFLVHRVHDVQRFTSFSFISNLNWCEHFTMCLSSLNKQVLRSPGASTYELCVFVWLRVCARVCALVWSVNHMHAKSQSKANNKGELLNKPHYWLCNVDHLQHCKVNNMLEFINPTHSVLLAAAVFWPQLKGRQAWKPKYLKQNKTISEELKSR